MPISNPSKPTLTLVVAASKAGVIGVDNRLPWHLPSDLAYFKSVTMGKPILMGRNTWQSIGRVLPGRDNIVISSQPREQLHLPDAVWLYPSIEAALEGQSHHEELMIIGGAQIFRAVLPIADRILMNWVDIEVEGDTYFPPIDPAIWQRISSEYIPADEKNPYAHERVKYERL